MTPSTFHPKAPTSTAPLLYWLLVICGLGGITMQRLDALDDVLPLWAGTIAGLALGQLVAWARIRVWVLAALGMTALWLSPIFFIVFYRGFGNGVETCLYAAAPAAICGYLSLSERGALVAFWYPAALWMLVVLDGPSSTALDTRTALPLVIGLTALFVAYLRARETRRVALWRVHAPVRLATPISHGVLRASPLRAASQHAWTALAGAGALVLAAWIAPHLWQTEKTGHASAASASAHEGGNGGPTASAGGPERCCTQAAMLGTKRVRAREYFPLAHGNDEDHGLSAASPRPSCTVCQEGDGDGTATASANDYEGFGNGTSGSGWSTGTSPPPYAYGAHGGGPGARPGASFAPDFPGFADPMATTPMVASPVASPGTWPSEVAPVAPVASPSPVAPGGANPAPSHPFAAEHGASIGPSTHAHGSGGTPTVIVLQPAAAPPTLVSAPPWKTVLFVSALALALRALVRAVRRTLTLRHLARPFWRETLDQRISNHWERILIALRDAGIRASDDEQPEALAKRVGIDGMETCATILERVRHGVRVDEGDLLAMSHAADAVVCAAEQKAGVVGRAAALVRWPLA